ncbi:UspA domain protein [Halosimplex carlsbadense 2-9-1]|uniref:UspA domain protein n=1 Tax=Halosimplex carlsbadense 2-9-1 TaxID=797114 RepID=M0CPI2_9EURY|nr:universal stress protein [Halosimplex carlsbadense]ELZ24307.1 UspA domain protein [Halosimplex carlsbadense 2-9-1]
MAKPFFQRVVVPVANSGDAEATAATLVPYAEGTDCEVVAVHVIEKAGEAPNKASVEQREQWAQEMFAAISDGLSDTGVTLETKTRYGTDIAATVIDAAHEFDATAIAFTPRGRSRWRKLLAGDVTHNLVTNTDVPSLVLSDRAVSER